MSNNFNIEIESEELISNQNNNLKTIYISDLKYDLFKTLGLLCGIVFLYFIVNIMNY